MRRAAPLVTAVVAAAVLTACSSGTPKPKPTSGPAACKADMADQLTVKQLTYTSGGVILDGMYPSSCDGLSDATLQDIASTVLAEKISKDMNS